MLLTEQSLQQQAARSVLHSSPYSGKVLSGVCACGQYEIKLTEVK